jgi:hypothetical protein
MDTSVFVAGQEASNEGFLHEACSSHPQRGNIYLVTVPRARTSDLTVVGH